MLLLATLAIAESYVVLEPEDWTSETESISNYALRGYTFETLKEFTIYGAEWHINLPPEAHIAFRIWGDDNVPLFVGHPAAGTGASGWHAAPVEFTFEQGKSYDVGFYLDAPDDVEFTRVSNTGNYPDQEWITELSSRSNQSDSDSDFSTYNTWPSRMRLHLDAPDADADGVPSNLDCDDLDPLNSPELDEVCDDADNDCDSDIDEDGVCESTAGDEAESGDSDEAGALGADLCCGTSNAALLLFVPIAIRRRRS